MKKLLLILSTISILFLAGCKTNTDIPTSLPTNQENQQITEIPNIEILSQTAKETLVNSLKNNEWVKENVSMKQTYFGEPFTSDQELTFEKISDDLIIVQAYSYETDNDFGVQVFLVGYKDGEIKVVSLPEDIPMHPGHGGYALDKENQILLSVWAHQGGLNHTAYKINNLTFEEIDNIKYASEAEYDEEAIKNFEAKYTNATTIKNKLTNIELDRVFNFNNVSIPDYLEFVNSESYHEYTINKYEGYNDETEIIIQSADGSIAYQQHGLNQQIKIENDKLYIASYDEPAGYVEGAIGDFNYYRVDYELFEKEGKFEANKLKVDYEDVFFTAQT